MTNQAFNPYEPPSMEVDEIPQKALSSGEYRIEKNTLIIHEPYRLPQVCFWSDAVSDLTDCDFQIRVMPRWWAFRIALIVSLRFRKPWSHLVGSLTKDGDIVIFGLRPEVLSDSASVEDVGVSGRPGRGLMASAINCLSR